MPFKKIDPKQTLPKMEEEILKFWNENRTFEKSVKNREGAPLYSFYDGPPFATGLPHHGHLLASTSKDVVPRYWTMKGYKVPRRWGWDTHGLPIENIVEKKLGYSSKKEIEANIGKFNEEARDTVLQFADEWKKTVNRIGRWIDFDNSYKTMDKDFMESVWWGFNELHKKGLVYKDSRISLYCPHCATPLSNFEIAMDNSYKDDKDPSAYVEMALKGEERTGFLVWTTTPWTLPANVALAVGAEIDYVKIEKKDEGVGELVRFILAKDRLQDVLGEEEYRIVEEYKGRDLVGKEYEPIFNHDIENGYKVVAGGFVTTDSGTGIVHIAPAFGEDDFNLRKKENLPIIQNVDEEGKLSEGAWVGMNVWDANFKILTYLKENNVLFKKENITHSYPHCYRCDAKLIYKAQPAWFIKVSEFKKDMLEENEKISWHPNHLKEGRFKNGLETAPDWNVSRSRYWGNPMPIWECDKCGKAEIVGSYDELHRLSGKRLKDYHRPHIDEVTFGCDKCDGTMKRISDVFDCWVESGSMPFAEFHYPFENRKVFEERFPAQFISEYIAQTRGWFYTLHALSVGLFGKPSFLNAVTTGTIAGNDGKKMSKSLKNFTDPNVLIDKFGADAFRLYLMQSPLMEGENLSFSDKELEDLFRGVFRMLWNSYSFFTLYADIDKWDPEKTKLEPAHLLDRWIVSELNLLIKEVDENMETYHISKASRAFNKFIDNLSNWYIRRSRKRFWKSENDDDKNQAYATLYHVLVELSKLMAPFTPFISEEIYKNLTQRESVHLEDFPKSDDKAIDDSLNAEMGKVREIISEGLQLRAKAKIKVRQPLQSVSIKNEIAKAELVDIVKDELNIKEVVVDKEQEGEIILNTEITEELKLEGHAREIIRAIQEMRKETDYIVDNRIEIAYASVSAVFSNSELKELIKKETLANSLEEGTMESPDIQKELNIDGEKISISIRKA